MKQQHSASQGPKLQHKKEREPARPAQLALVAADRTSPFKLGGGCRSWQEHA